MRKIFVLGSLNMDLVISAPCIPAAGETICGSGFMANPGGKGANQAAACAKLGGHVLLGGCVGNDDFGVALCENLTASGVNTEQVYTAEGHSTGVAVIVIAHGDNRIILDAGANDTVDIARADALLQQAGEGDILLTQLEIPIETVGYALKKAASLNMLTILNPAPAYKQVVDYLEYVDIIVPNETELALLTGKYDVDEGIHELIKQGIRTMIVTMGSKGLCCYTEGRITYMGKAAVDAVVDTTAAGDTFCGALAVGLAEDCTLIDTLRYANHAAALTVTKKGAQASIPTRKEVDVFMSRF
ncbi:MAG: ribokinase [Oscillospiraceae bacterium]|nr:ribokinase [Oscillospiraceae bacterium]